MNMSFFNIMLCYYFSLEAVLQDMKEKKRTPCKNLGDIEAYASALTHRRENVKLIAANCKDIF